MTKDLPYFAYCFTHLNRDHKNGGAPHKPILLLSILQLYDRGVYNDNKIYILPELVSLFKTLWTRLVTTNHHPIFALPFNYMNSEPFWDLIPNLGYERWIEAKGVLRSFKNLTSAVNYASVDNELSDLLQVKENREVLKLSILEKYFPGTTMEYEQQDDESDLLTLLQEDTESYVQKILDLKKNVDENSFQEEVFIRNGIFKREIPKIYNYTCAISGLRLDAVANISMIDACHIVPFADAYNDSLTNGFALCPNLHRAFDRGLIAISENYEVLINNGFIENSTSPYNISQFEGKTLTLPTKNENLPSPQNFANHRKRFNFKAAQ